MRRTLPTLHSDRARAKLNALVIDDDPGAAGVLRHHLSRHPGVHIVGEAHTLRMAESLLARPDYDVVFLEVHMSGGTGFDVVPRVRPDAAIIFVTGRADHAVRAFEINAVDYILKPVTATRLDEALRRLQKPPGGNGFPAVRFQVGDRVFLRGAAAGGRFVAVEEIVAVLSSENYTQVLLANGERWMIRRTLEAWAAVLPTNAFTRVHRTALVNLERVERVERTAGGAARLALQGVRPTVPVGRRIWPALRARLQREGLI